MSDRLRSTVIALLLVGVCQCLALAPNLPSKDHPGAGAAGTDAERTAPCASNGEVLTIAGHAINVAQGQMKVTQVVAAVLGLMLILLGGWNVKIVGSYTAKLRRLQSMFTELKDAKARLEAEVSNLQKEKTEVVRGIEELRAEGLRLVGALGVLCDVNTVRLGSGEARHSALQRLAQRVDPAGVYPMIEVLVYGGNADGLRVEAAYGLGRYSEQINLADVWADIVTAFFAVLSGPTTSRKVALEVIRSARKFGAAASSLQALYPRWLDGLT